ncbi:MAG: prespore-specific protein [Linnemannia elongata]|nr:MAG: prespore-specific protein [Linnemannia elongata]
MSIPQNTNLAETFAELTKSDEKVTSLANSHFSKPASAERVNAARAALEKNGFKVHVVNTRADAFEAVKNLIPAGVSINNAHSTTLEEIGFITYIKGETPWKNIHGSIVHEKDAAKQAILRRTLGSTVDYYLTSVAAVTETGHLAHGDLSGSKVGPVAFAAGSVIVIAGSNKIVKDEQEAWKRQEEFALPLESARVRIAYGLPQSNVTHYEYIRTTSPFNANRIQVILVNEALGY